MGYCSKICQKNDWRVHKTSCHRRRKLKTTPSNSNAPSDESVRLEVKSGDRWEDAGPINLIDGVANLNISGGSSTSHDVSRVMNQPTCLTKELPSKVQTFLGKNNYRFRHSPDEIDTNLLVLFHGAGDTHEPYDNLAKRMELPQTASLALSARNVALPLGLGYTWFEEMSSMGEPLGNEDQNRLSSLGKAVDWLEQLLNLLIGLSPNSTGPWIPERIFLFGFSAGACLVMEACRSWNVNGRLPLGGAICVAGGIKSKTLPTSNSTNCVETQSNQATDILLISGKNDGTYSPESAIKSKNMYGSHSKVQLYTQQNKGHSMIGSRDEMQVVMEFLSHRLVKRMASMENMAR